MTGSDHKQIVLQERDERLLREIGTMRVIDREQARHVGGFNSTTRVNVRLLALTRARLLKRFFIGTEARGMKALYTLTREGERICGGAQPGLRRKHDQVLVADSFVTHQLHVNEVYCVLKFHTIQLPEVRFLRWTSFRTSIEAGQSLIPDGYVEVADHNDVMAAFVEVDLGTEPLSIWRNKVQEYLRYAIGNSAVKDFGHSRFRVLAITNSEERLLSIKTATAALTDKIFWFTTFQSIRKDGFWSPIWQRPTISSPRALLHQQT